ncbi:hypothetical protein [Vibrio phage VP4B]|uniref:Uncharacterized protein n=1 Tax=Vibrio phage VP4B TaxID=1262540 RepID=V9LZN5_9CAUD|nr:hypothetical protein FDJ61_gp041 [Vibrio phage VP4B]AGB07155.1 hypothetical protein [Vibrio phage VP4B]
MEFLKDRPSKDEIRLIKAGTGIAVAALQTAVKGEVQVKDLVCTAIGTTVSVANTRESERYRINAREDAVWNTVGNILVTNVIASLIS